MYIYIYTWGRPPGGLDRCPLFRILGGRGTYAHLAFRIPQSKMRVLGTPLWAVWTSSWAFEGHFRCLPGLENNICESLIF